MILWNDTVVPLGDDMRRKFGDHLRGDRLEDMLCVTDVRLDFLDVWLKWRVRECVLDNGVRIRLQNILVGHGNSMADCGADTLVGILADEKPKCGEPRKVCFEEKANKASENALL